MNKTENIQKDKKERKRNENIIPHYDFLFSEDGGSIQNHKKVKNNFLSRFFKKNFLTLFVSTIVNTIKSSPLWIMPLITANIINIITYRNVENITKTLIWNGIFLFIIIVQNIPTHYLYARMTDKMLRRTSAGVKSVVVRKLQHLSISYHKQIETGKIQSKFLKDIEQVDGLLANIVRTIIPCVVGAIISIGISIYKSGIVTLFFLVIIPINLLVSYLYRKKMRKNNREYRIENENLSSKLTNMLEMIAVTKAHGLENEEIENLDKNINNLTKKGLNVDNVLAFFGSSVWVISTVLSGACLLFCAFLALNNKITVGDVVLYQSLFASINSNIQQIINSVPQLNVGLEAVDSISEILQNDDVENNNDKIPLNNLEGNVSFKNVSYKYPNSSEYVIDSFNLEVKKGECIAFVGASGSGKSTIMNMIIGFIHPQVGEVDIDGINLNNLNLTDYRHHISVVPQNSILFSGTIRENITYGLNNYSNEELNRVVEMSNISEFLKDLPNGLDTEIGEKGGLLSGGQKQRITIARALIRNPEILILDEATSALDNISEYHVQNAIDKLIKGRTTFIVAHRLSTIRNADRIVVMESGKCVEIGDYNSLIEKKGKFYELKRLNDINYKKAEDALN